MFNKKIKNNRGQIAEAMTWMVATVIIVIFLGLLIFVTNFTYSSSSVEVKKSTDLTVAKSLSAYLWSKDINKNEYVYQQLGKDESLNSFNSDLAKKIFKEYYYGSFLSNSDIWFGVVKGNNHFLNFNWNLPFGKKPVLDREICLFEDRGIKSLIFVRVVLR